MSERIADAYPAGWHWPAAPNDLDTADAAVRDAFQRRDLSCLRKAYVGFEQASLKAFVPMVDTIGGNVGAALTPEDLPNDWRLLYEERAAIAEYDGGLSREQAEAQALRDVVKAMERLHQPVAAVRAGGV